ncbi:hypothetical protein ACVMH6_000536 [Rhizobium leguminosarum]
MMKYIIIYLEIFRSLDLMLVFMSMLWGNPPAN